LLPAEHPWQIPETLLRISDKLECANAKPAPAAPTLAALKELETKAFDAYKNKDGKFFEGFLDDKFVMGGMGKEDGQGRHCESDLRA
jgi:hypothetical protein